MVWFCAQNFHIFFFLILFMFIVILQKPRGKRQPEAKLESPYLESWVSSLRMQGGEENKVTNMKSNILLCCTRYVAGQCSHIKQVYAPSSNQNPSGTKTGLCRTDCSTGGGKCCDNFRRSWGDTKEHLERSVQSKKAEETSSRNHLLSTSILPLITEWSTEVVATATHLWDITAAPPLTKDAGV